MRPCVSTSVRARSSGGQMAWSPWQKPTPAEPFVAPDTSQPLLQAYLYQPTPSALKCQSVSQKRKHTLSGHQIHTHLLGPLLIQERTGAPSLVILLVCVLGLLSYVVAAAILHKLDQLDLRRAGVVPLCGRDGLFKYEIQVKTGWSRGAGELGR